MTELYLTPLTDDWLELFNKTVANPLDTSGEDVPDELSDQEKVRLWGTPEPKGNQGAGARKRIAFEGMEKGDLILFHNKGEFFAAGRIGETFVSRKIAEWAWDRPESLWIYTITDFEEISIKKEKLWEVLGFSDNYRLHGLRGLSDNARDSLLQQYNSVEEAFRDLKGSADDEEDKENEEDEGVSAELVEASDETATEHCAGSYETAPYYFVKQTDHPEEIEEGYLRAPADNDPLHDVGRLEEGDIVFNYTDNHVVGYSVVTDTAYPISYDGEQHCRVEVDVNRFVEPLRFAAIFEYLDRDEVRIDPYYPIHATGINQGYLFNLSEKAGEYLLELGTERGSQVERLERRMEFPPVTFAMPEGLHFHGLEEVTLRRQIEAALNSGKHIIFTGPPGTGKTKLAKAVCESVRSVDSVDDYTFTTATADWTTFDTIGGYVPSPVEGHQLEFDPRLFLDCFRTSDGEIINEWLVIDELNRADIDKAFGQLFSVLARDSVELPYERADRVRIDWVDVETPDDELVAIATNEDRFPVTPAWRLIATMNTFDKTSLYDLSFAFMRRFSFIHVGVPPLAAVADEDVVRRDLLDPDDGPNYATAWMETDEHLADPIDEYHEELALIWYRINQHRTIGPAIIRDILGHLNAYEGGDETGPLTSAIVGLVFPQLEGMRQDEQAPLVESLGETGYIEGSGADDPHRIEPRVDEDYLWRKAMDMFDLDRRT